MKLKCYASLIFGTLMATVAHSQKGYIISDSAYTQGHVLSRSAFKNNREVLFTERLNGKAVAYLPGQLKEYGFAKDVYISKIVKDREQSVRYFLLRLVNGDRKLFSLKIGRKTRYFIDHDSTLTEIRRDAPLEGQLSGVLKLCGSTQTSVSMARFTKSSLMRFVTLNNSCFEGLLPRVRTGLLIGYSTTSISLTSSFNHVSLDSHGSSPLVGAFIDFPLGVKPVWFVTIQGHFQQNNFSGFVSTGNRDFNYTLRSSTTSLPILLKWKSSGSTWRPFFNLGAIPSYNVQRQNLFFISTKNGSSIETSKSALDVVKKIQVAGTLGAGLERSLTAKKSVGLELRYSRLIDSGFGFGQTLALISYFYF